MSMFNESAVDADHGVSHKSDNHVVWPQPAIDPECAVGLEAIRAALPDELTSETILQFRETTRRLAAVSDDVLCRDGAFGLAELRVPGPEGDPDIALLVCLPTVGEAPFPTIYNIHGGGMISGDARSALAGVLDFAAPLGIAVVSVEYRLAPEHPYPAPVEDCYAGLKWTVDHADQLGIDPGRIVVAGGSAGGGLAAGVALLARDRNGPALLGQLLMAPMLDDRNDTVSAIQMTGSGVWDRAANRVGWQALLGERVDSSTVPPYAAPARATDLSGLPPTLIDVGSAETFRDEAITYAARICQAGGSAELHLWPGGFHGYDFAAPDATLSQATNRARQDWLRRLLSS